jgi:phosphoribosylaminoimidazolecarboxamide formyltransferase/IMP cyclohydrolase
LEELSLKKISRALLSVSDKTGIVAFAQTLARHGIEIISTGGTARLLRQHGLAVRDVSELTGFPEMLDGRVKTLHPKVHGGILGIRNNKQHQAQMQAHAIAPIDLVVVNLYPFHQTIQRPDLTLADAIENIDIGGPAMIRSAAKNHQDVAVVVDPADYQMVCALLATHQGSLPQATRYQLAIKAFQHTSAYDQEIARFLETRTEAVAADQKVLPAELRLELKKMADLRYGENPHQRAALYQLGCRAEKGVAVAEQLQGKELSYNNLVDADAAWKLVLDIDRTLRRWLPDAFEVQPHTCAIIKHTNPCGAATGATALEAFTKARSTDPVSAFGGIVAFSQVVDEAAARAIADMFAEVILAPDFTESAREVLAAKKNLRLLRLGKVEESPSAYLHLPSFEFRRISGGVLLQEQDNELFDERQFQPVSERQPTESELRALRFAWAIAKHVKSNAVVYAREGQLVGVGAGQMSRVDSVKIGAMKAQLPLAGTVLASDAFFPFRDGVDEAARHGITAIIQPGGSVRDQEVIQAANEHHLAMIFTGMRHFKH